jgi:hypothetical protein
MSEQSTSGWVVPRSFAFWAYRMRLRALALGMVSEIASKPLLLSCRDFCFEWADSRIRGTAEDQRYRSRSCAA